MNMMWTSKVDTRRGEYPCIPGESGGWDDSVGDTEGIEIQMINAKDKNPPE